MAQPILQPGENFLNPYEKMYSILKNTNPHFDENIWNKVINGSSVGTDVNLYIDAIEKIKDLDTKAISDDYKLEYSDWNAKLMAQLNEAYKEQNLQNIQKRERYVRNDDGSIKMENYEPVTEPYEINDYDYIKNMIREQGEIGYQNYLLQQEKERKESMDGFTKFLAGTAATGGHLVTGFLKEIEGIGNFFAGLGVGINEAIAGSNTFQKGMADYIVNRDAKKEWGTQLEDLLIDFESRYTHLRDIDGNLTGAGKFFVSTAESFGQMAPSMIVTAATAGVGGAIGGVAGQVISKGIPVISQTIFYSGITANQAREMYQYYAQYGVTVPTEEILTNAEMKSVGQAAVENMLGKLMGGSALDNLTYGRAMGKSFAGKSFAGKGLARLAHDFIEEGSEEVLQEFSDYFVDKIWQSQYKNWGQFADITPENLGLSFVIGGISSFIGSAMRIIRTPNMKVATSIDADGNVTYKNLGKGVVGKVASWEYGITLQEAISNVNKIIEHRQSVFDALSRTNILAEKFGSLKADVASKELGRMGQEWSERDLRKADVALTQAYASYRMLASIYQEVGPERFNAANDLLIFGSKNNDSAFYELSADMLMNKLNQLGSTIPQKITTKRGKEKNANVFVGEFRDLIIERKLGNIKAVFSKEDTTKKESEMSPEVKKLYDDYKELNKVIVTDSGEGAIDTGDGTVIVPSPEINNAGSETVLADIAEQKVAGFVLEQINTDKHLLGMDLLTDLYEKVFGRTGTKTEVIYALCYNDKFYRACIFKANKDSLKLLVKIIDKFSSIVVSDKASGILKSKYNKIIKSMKEELKQSLVYNYRANLQDIPSGILTDKEKQEIVRERWKQTLLYRIVNEYNNITEDDKRMILLTINNMTLLSDKMKSELKEQVFDKKDNVRTGAVNEIKNYFDSYRNRYDGTYYMPENSVPNIVFNKYLSDNNLYIHTLFNENGLTKSDIEYMKDNNMNIIQYRQNQFSRYCNNKYRFVYNRRIGYIDETGKPSKGQILIYETSTNKVVGFTDYLFKRITMMEKDEKFTYKKSKFSEIANITDKISKLSKSFIRKDFTEEQKSDITMTDIIFTEGLLSDEINNRIVSSYGLESENDITPEMRYTYLRSTIPLQIPSVSINVTSEGEIVFVNLRPYEQIFKTKFTKNELLKSKSIRSLVKENFLVGKLGDVTLEISSRVKNLSYNRRENVIYINENSLKKYNDEETRWCLFHEFQHAVADQSGLNSGFTTNISKSVKNKDLLKQMVEDVKNHVPEAFQGKDTWEEQVEAFDAFVYEATGETLAYGLEFSGIVNFYPVIVDRKGKDGIVVIMPWGSVYNFTNEYAVFVTPTIKTIFDNGTTTANKEQYLSDVTSAYVLDGQIYKAENEKFDDISNKLKEYFSNFPNNDLEKSIAKISIDGRTVKVEVSASTLYNERNETSTIVYETIQKALQSGNDVRFVDSTYRDGVDGSVYTDNPTISNIADIIDDLYESALQDDELSLDYMTYDGKVEQEEIKIVKETEPAKKKKPTKKAGRYITDESRNQFESLKNIHSAQMSPELQDFYKTVETDDNVDSVLRDLVLKGKLRWNATKDSDMSVNYYLRTADNINDATFKAINDAFFKNKYITNFKELSNIVNNVPNMYSLYIVLRGTKYENLLEVLNPTSANLFINNELSKKENKDLQKRFMLILDEYERKIGEGFWREGGNDGYFRLNSMKYYNGTIVSLYQFANELPGIVNSIYNKKRKGDFDGDGFDIFEKRLTYGKDSDSMYIFGQSLRDHFENLSSMGIETSEMIKNTREILLNMLWYDVVSLTKKNKLTFDTREQFSTFLKKVLEYDSMKISNLLSGSFSDKYIIEKLYDNWVKRPLGKYDSEKYTQLYLGYVNNIAKQFGISIDSLINREKNEITSFLSGREMREPRQLVTSINYYYRKFVKGISIKEAELLVQKNPELFVYNKETGEFKLNKDAYLTKLESSDKKYIYKTSEELREVRDKMINISYAVLTNAYRSEKDYKYWKKQQEKIQKAQEDFKKTILNSEKGKKTTVNKIVTYVINDTEVKIEGTDNMPDSILNLMRNYDIKVAKTNVQKFADEDSVHVKADLTDFVKRNWEILSTLEQSDVDDIISYYLTHSNLSDQFSVNFETTRGCLLAYILRESNEYSDNPKYILSADTIRAIDEFMTVRASKGGQILRLQRKIIAMLNPAKDILEELASSYGFDITPDKIENLAQAINDDDVKTVAKLKNEIYKDFISQSRIKQTYSEFVKDVNKFVDSESNDYLKLLQTINNQLEQEKRYSENSFMYKRLNDLRRLLEQKLELENTIKSTKMSEDVINWFKRHHKERLTQKEFVESKLFSLFDNFDDYRNSWTAYQIERELTSLQEYLQMKVSKKGVTFWDKLWNFERAMMLTSPGTWARNQISDVTLYTTNRISDGLIQLGDKLFDKSKKWHKEGQYRIASISTKDIPSDVKEFIDLLTDKKQENNLFSQIDDTVNKYDVTRIKKNTPDMNLAELIVNKLASDVTRGEIDWSKITDATKQEKLKKAVSKAKKFLFKALSDSVWVKIEFKRVLARMIVEEREMLKNELKSVQNDSSLSVKEKNKLYKQITDKIKELDVKNGLSNSLQTLIAEAYTFAAQTYMHKSNVMNKFDELIRTKFGPTGYFMWKQVFPFASASWNWFSEGLSYSPVGLVKGVINLIKLDKTVLKLETARQKGETVVSSKFAEYLAKRNIGHGIIGTFGWIIGGLLAGFGKVMLDDDDKKYKLRAGNIVIDISDLFGASGVLIGMGTVQSIMETEGGNWFDKFVSVMNTMLNQIFIDSTFSDLYNTFRYDKSFGDYLSTLGIYNIPSMFIPNAIKSTSALFNKNKVKYESGPLGKLERLAFQLAPYLVLLDSVPKYIDPYTGEKQVPFKLDWFEGDWLIPSIWNKYLGTVDFKPYKVSEFEKEAINLGISKSMLTGKYTINGEDVVIKGKTLEDINNYYGNLNNEQLTSLFNDTLRMKVQMSNGKYKELKYSQMTDKQKKNSIENIMNKNSEYTKIYLMTTKYDYKYFANDEEFKTLRKLGITENVYRANNKYKGFIKK